MAKGESEMQASHAGGRASRPAAVFVGRQPIYDRQLDVVAYELFFRRDATNRADIADGDEATAHVLIHAFLDIGLDTLVGRKRAFINLTRGFLFHNYVGVFPPDRVVLELSETATADAELLAVMRTLSMQGYTLVLDNFRYREAARPLLELADLVKLDVQALGHEGVAAQVACLRPYGVALVAAKVETPADFDACKALGIDYFQGYFLCRPDVVAGRRAPTNRLALVQLLARLHDPAVSVQEVEALVSRDVTLTYKLLRVINSAFFGLPRRVSSIRQAILLLGLNCIATWASIMLLSGIGDKPHELWRLALVRAKMCEQLGQDTGQAPPETFFLVGLLSVLDALLDQPLAAVLDALPLTEAVRRALLHHEGPLGTALRCAVAYERGAWDEVLATGIAPQRAVQAYLEALAWSAEASELLSPSPAPA